MADDVEEMFEDIVLMRSRINGKLVEELVPPGMSLLTFLREQRALTGTHMGCMTGHCGACTVLIDGQSAKSCITLAATIDRAQITTIEGLTNEDGTLGVIQGAFRDASSFQCGFCAPGMLLTTAELLEQNPDPTDAEIGDALAGNLCRCTGYRSIYAGVKLAAARLRDEAEVV